MKLSFQDESWEGPEEDNSSPETVREVEGPVAEVSYGEGNNDTEMLWEQWQLNHGRDPPPWADRGFAGIRKDMEQRAAETEEIIEEVILYCPAWELEPRQCLWAYLDPLLPGIKFPVVHSANYAEGQPIPAHALPQLLGNPLDNFNVLSPVP